MPTKILALDVATTTGFAFGDGTRPPLAFKVRFKGDSRGLIGDEFRQYLRRFVASEKPDLIAFEAPLVQKKEQGSDTPRLLMGMAMIVEMIAGPRFIPCKDVSVDTWRKSFFGHARNFDERGLKRNWKREAVEFCEMLGWDVGGSHDAAEACGVWAHAHLTMGGNRAAMAKLLSRMTVAGMAR